MRDNADREWVLKTIDKVRGGKIVFTRAMYESALERRRSTGKFAEEWEFPGCGRRHPFYKMDGKWCKRTYITGTPLEVNVHESSSVLWYYNTLGCQYHDAKMSQNPVHAMLII